MVMIGFNEEAQLQGSVPTASLRSGQSSGTIREPQFMRQVPWNELSSVYLIRNDDLGLCKIGFSDSVRRRRRELQAKSAFNLRLVAEWRCPKVAARAFESILHDKLSTCRSHGEWFAIDDETLAEIEQAVIFQIPMHRIHDGKLRKLDA